MSAWVEGLLAAWGEPETAWVLLLGAAGLAVLALGIWLKRLQARFVAELRAEGNPLADHIGTKTFRQRFQAWLFGLGEAKGGPAPGRSLLTLAMVILIGAAAAVSLWPGSTE